MLYYMLLNTFENVLTNLPKFDVEIVQHSLNFLKRLNVMLSNTDKSAMLFPTLPYIFTSFFAVISSRFIRINKIGTSKPYAILVYQFCHLIPIICVYIIFIKIKILHRHADQPIPLIAGTIQNHLENVLKFHTG